MSLFGNFEPIGSCKSPQEDFLYPTEISTGDVLEESPETRSFHWFLSVIAILFTVLIFRLLNLQVAQGAHNLTLAEGNRIRTEIETAPRGIITDQSGQTLVKNIVRYDLALLPTNLPVNRAEREKIFQKLEERFPGNESLAKAKKSSLFSLEPFIIQSNITHEQAIQYQVELDSLSGLTILKQPIRSYPTDKGLGHVIGYIGKVSQKELEQDKSYIPADWTGKTGLEYFYEKEIKGINGQKQIEVDAQGRLQRIIAIEPPRQGNALELHLDLPLQEVTYNALKKMADERGVKKGAAIALDPKTGGIYSFVSLPDFNPNVFVQGDDKGINEIMTNPDQPLLNRAISGTYPSGSAIKPLYASAGLQEKVVSPSLTIDTPSEIKIGQFVFPDWKDHGPTDIRRAIAESNNIFFYAIGGGWDKIKGLGIKRMEEYLKKFGLGSKTDIDLPGEVEGFVPNPDWKKRRKKEPWYIGDTYHLSIGQGDIAVTPMQMAVVTSAIANDGKLVEPRFASRLKDENNQDVEVYGPKFKKENIIDHDNLQIVREGMRQTVESGSARTLNDLKKYNGDSINAAGKTGTAQTGKDDKTHAWFVGFAPWNDPKIAVVILIEEGGEGNETAVPVASEMFKAFFREGNKAAE